MPGAAPDGDESSRVSKTVDVLIKAVRVVANLSINETIGSRIAATDQCVMLLLQILGTLARSLTCCYRRLRAIKVTCSSVCLFLIDL